LKLKSSILWTLFAAIVFLTGCDGAKPYPKAENKIVADTPPVTIPSIDLGKESLEWASRQLTRDEVRDYTLSPNVREAFRRRSYEIAKATICWPEMRKEFGEGASAYKRSQEFWIDRGVHLRDVACEQNDVGPPAPSNGNGDIVTGYEAPPTPFQELMSPEVGAFAIMYPAQVARAVQMPAKPSGWSQRRWRSPIRILMPDDLIIRAQLRQLISDPAFQDHTGRQHIQLVSERPNVIIMGLLEAQRCPDYRPRGSAAFDPEELDRCLEHPAYPQYDRMARFLTDGGLSYTQNGSDLFDVNPDSNTNGFILADKAGSIRGALCLLPDSMVHGRLGLGPEFSASWRKIMATECLARIMGLGGVWRPLHRPNTPNPPFKRAFVSVEKRESQEEVVLSPVALSSLDHLYH